MDSKLPPAAPDAAAEISDAEWREEPTTTDASDYFVSRDGIAFAGTHLLIDLWDAHDLSDVGIAEKALRDAVDAAGATLLGIDVHHFGPNQGVSGIAVIAESHISIHTWPERGYAAIDIFMCGDCNPYDAVPVLKRAFRPGAVQLAEHKRGIVG